MTVWLLRLAPQLRGAAVRHCQGFVLPLAAIQYTLGLAGTVKNILEGAPVADPMSFGELRSWMWLSCKQRHC